MNRSTFFPALAAVAVCAGSCGSRIFAGDIGVESPDGSYRLAITSYGACGKACVDYTKKGRWAWIGTGVGQGRKQILNRIDTVTGYDVRWKTRWSSAEGAVVDVFDFGYGVSKYDAAKRGARSNHLARVAFQLEKRTGAFVEKYSPI